MRSQLSGQNPPMYEGLAPIAGAVTVYNTVAGGIERTWFTGPFIFTLFGRLIGPLSLNLISVE